MFGFLCLVLVCSMIRIFIELKAKCNQPAPSTSKKSAASKRANTQLNQAILRESEEINIYRLQSQRQSELNEARILINCPR